MVQVSLRYEAINVNSTCAATSRIEVPRLVLTAIRFLFADYSLENFPSINPDASKLGSPYA